MKPNNGKITYEQAKRLIINHVRAFICAYVLDDSDEIKFYYPMIPVLQNDPSKDLEELFCNFCDSNF